MSERAGIRFGQHKHPKRKTDAPGRPDGRKVNRGSFGNAGGRRPPAGLKTDPEGSPGARRIYKVYRVGELDHTVAMKAAQMHQWPDQWTMTRLLGDGAKRCQEDSVAGDARHMLRAVAYDHDHMPIGFGPICRRLPEYVRTYVRRASWELWKPRASGQLRIQCDTQCDIVFNLFWLVFDGYVRIWISLCLPVCVSLSQPVCLPVCLSVCLSVCLLASMSVCLYRCHNLDTAFREPF